MSAESKLVRFDTRRAAQTEESSQQTDFRTIGAREHGQLALDELDTESRAISESQASADTRTSEEPTRADLEAALGCARTTIAGLQKRVAQLEAERERVAEHTKPEEDDSR